MENPILDEESTGGRLVAADGRALPLAAMALKCDARGGVASVLVEQRFVNPYDEPLRVTYLLPLPSDGAVSAFAFRIGDRRVVGEVDRRAAARERFEQAIVDGRSAALVEQDRSSLFTQEIGNVPPRAEVVAELTIDQKLAWLDEGQWEWRFPTTVGPRYMGGPGRVADRRKITVEIADRPLGPRLTMALTIRDRLVDGKRPESPSHALRADEGATHAVTFRDGGAPLDRDVVVRWPVAQARVGLAIDVARPSSSRANGAFAYGLLTVVPPSAEARGPALARDLIALLDTSGSMGGQPLDQARRVVGALVDTLTDGDSLEMIEFGNSPRRWKREPVRATAAARKEAHAWLASLRASGGTEMRSGIVEALRPLRKDSQRQVVLVTDGLIGFEEEVVREIADRLPKGSRVHAVGVGSSVNRSLTGPAARAGRGVEIVIGLGEDPERAARRLVARTDAPLVVDVAVEGSALQAQAPARAGDLFAGAPSLIALRLKPEGGTLRVTGKTANGKFAHAIEVAPAAPSTGSAAVVALFGREAVEDLELRAAAGERDLDEEVERIGLDFQIATRMTSWVAISEEATVDPNAPSRRETMPHELPHGMSMEGLGLRAPSVPQAAPTGVMKSMTMYSAGQAYRPATLEAPPAPPPVGGPPPKDAPAPSMSAPPSPRASAPDARGGAGSGERGRGLFDKIGRIFKRAAHDDETIGESRRTPAPDDEGEVSKQAERAPELARMRGRITLRKKGQVVIEVVLTVDVDWQAPQLAQLTTGDGESVAPVDAGRSTRAGRLRAGQTLRIVLADESARVLDEVMLQLAGGRLIIEVER